LPARGPCGLCRPCARVYDGLRILSHRLLVRDVARLEHDTPGITTAIRAAIDTAELAPSAPLPAPLDRPAATAWGVLPDAAALEDLELLVRELRLALGVKRERA
jgi:hypothetical protein